MSAIALSSAITPTYRMVLVQNWWIDFWIHIQHYGIGLLRDHGSKSTAADLDFTNEPYKVEVPADSPILDLLSQPKEKGSMHLTTPDSQKSLARFCWRLVNTIHGSNADSKSVYLNQCNSRRCMDSDNAIHNLEPQEWCCRCIRYIGYEKDKLNFKKYR